MFQRCAHVGLGCTIYAQRPEQCRVWSCQWLLGIGGEEDRPDRSGLVVDFQPKSVAGPVMKLFEIRAGAASTPWALALRKHSLAHGVAVVLVSAGSPHPRRRFLPAGLLPPALAAALRAEGYLLDTAPDEGTVGDVVGHVRTDKTGERP
jgi:hypothetical protein